MSVETSDTIQIEGQDWRLRTVPFLELTVRTEGADVATCVYLVDWIDHEIVVARIARPYDLINGVARAVLDITTQAREQNPRPSRRKKKP